MRAACVSRIACHLKASPTVKGFVRVKRGILLTVSALSSESERFLRGL